MFTCWSSFHSYLGEPWRSTWSSSGWNMLQKSNGQPSEKPLEKCSNWLFTDLLKTKSTYKSTYFCLQETQFSYFAMKHKEIQHCQNREHIQHRLNSLFYIVFSCNIHSDVMDNSLKYFTVFLNHFGTFLESFLISANQFVQTAQHNGLLAKACRNSSIQNTFTKKYKCMKKMLDYLRLWQLS